MSDRGRVLLAEDTPANIQLYRVVLGRAGYDVDVAEDGEKAVRCAAAKRYDIILMDLGLPVFDGFEATQRIRIDETGASLSTPIVALTADDDLKTRRACAAIGIVGYISKPVSPVELIKEIDQTIAANAAD